MGITTFGEIIILIFAGLCAGIFASFYSYLLTTKKLNFLNFGNKPFLLPAYAALICALVSIKFPEVEIGVVRNLNRQARSTTTQGDRGTP